MQRLRRTFPGVLATLLLVSALTPSPGVGGDGKIKKYKKSVPSEYIAVLTDDVRGEVENVARELSMAHGFEVQRLYRHGIVGFRGRMTEKQAHTVGKDPRVQWVEENGLGDLSARQTDTPAEWHLDRADQDDFPTPILDGNYTFCTSYVSNAVVYVFDTGMLRRHWEFEYLDHRAALDGSGPAYRVSNNGWNLVPDGASATDPTWASEVNKRLYNHGTAVASIIAGLSVGMDKTAFIWPVRVVETYRVRRLRAVPTTDRVSISGPRDSP